MQEKYDMAELFLERVTAQDGENLIAWTLFALLYEQRGQGLNAEITFKKAHKMNHDLHMNDVEISNIENELQASSIKKLEEGTKSAGPSLLFQLNLKKLIFCIENFEENDVMSKSENVANQQKISRASKRNTITQSGSKLLPAKSPKPPGFYFYFELRFLLIK